MSEKYKFQNPEGIYFLTSTVVHWIDLFTRKECKHIILESLKFCQEQKGLVIHGWCLMESHLHLVISTTGESLAAILRDFKKHTCRQLVKTLQEINESRQEWLLRAFTKAGEKLNRIQYYKVWQDGNHLIHLDTDYLQAQKLHYLHHTSKFRKSRSSKPTRTTSQYKSTKANNAVGIILAGATAAYSNSVIIFGFKFL